MTILGGETSTKDHVTGRRAWRVALVILVVGAGAAGLALGGRSMLAESVTTFGHVDWVWLPLAVIAEAGSMAAFARGQRQLLRAGATNVTLGSIIAVTYAGNAIAVSLPLAGSEVATAFTFRQFSRRGIDAALAGWTLAVSGMFSSVAFALILVGGAVASGSTSKAVLGLFGAALSLLPSLTVLAALRYPRVRRLLNRLIAGLVRSSRRLTRRPAAGAEEAFNTFLDRIAALRLRPLQALRVLALATWNWVADCLCLAAAIKATGIAIPWQGLFLAYGAGMAAASIGLTPGGLGIVETTLSAALVAAGIPAHRALTAVLVYRLISFWLVMATGWTVMAVLGRAAGARKEEEPERP